MTNRSFQSSVLTCVSLVILLSAVDEIRGEAPGLDPAKTHAVIVGVLHWQDPSLATYSPVGRKDRELYETLVEIGVPKKNMVLLLDEQAKLVDIRGAIRDVARRTAKGDTFIFYYAGHGSASASGICFMNFDAGKADSFAISDIASILSKEFHGERVLMFADCCFSGGLQQTAQQLADAGFKAASLTSAAATNTSTSNWTFTHILIDILGGSSAADRNGDQVITIGEAASEVSDAMKYREFQQHGQSRFKISKDFRLSMATSRPSPTTIPKPFDRFEYVQIQEENQWKTARVVDFKKGQFVTEIQQYSTRRMVNVDPSRLRKIPQVVFRNPFLFTSKPQKMLGMGQSLAKAKVDGKYNTLLKRIKVENDFRQYAEFSDYGYYASTSYATYVDLPAGYWVYVYPYWYIWKTKVDSAVEHSGLGKEEREPRGRRVRLLR
jgi:hypothetical protein